MTSSVRCGLAIAGWWWPRSSSSILIDPAELERQAADGRDRLAAERGQLLLRSMINERRRDTVVTVNNEFMERFAPRG